MRPQPLSKITIQGYKSIRSLVDFKLECINVLIGANGAGKSNFISFFRFVNEIMKQRLEFSVNMAGGADRLLHNGPKETTVINGELHNNTNGYRFVLAPTDDNRLIFQDESIYPRSSTLGTDWQSIGSGHSETKFLKKVRRGLHESSMRMSDIGYWMVYHFHDTSNAAQVRRQIPVRDNETLHPDAGNLTAFLYRLKNEYTNHYQRILQTVQTVAPFFKDFEFRPKKKGDEEYIELEWKQVNNDSIFFANQLSDGTIRFISLVTSLLQPNPPRTIIFDEPELGLHPYALHVLVELMHSIEDDVQLIISTQSIPFVNLFEPRNVIVTDRCDGATRFQRLNPKELEIWLKDEYSLGQLWEKNVIGGGVHYE